MGRLIWVLVDGLPFWLVEQTVASPAPLPVMRRLRRFGRMNRLIPAQPNCQTPPSLASLLTGTPPSGTGLTGFDIPDFAAEPLATVPAFERGVTAGLGFVWDKVRVAGGRMRLCHVPFVEAERLGDALVASSYGFVEPALPPLVERLPDGVAIRWSVRDGPTLVLERTARGARVRMLDERACEIDSAVVAVGSSMHLLLGDGLRTIVTIVTIDSAMHAVTLGAWRPIHHGDAKQIADDLDDLQIPYFAKTLSKLYRVGRLGRSLHEDGDGAAEHVLASAVVRLAERYHREALAAVNRRDADFVLAYQPAVDLVLHELIGFLDPACAHHTPPRAAIAQREIMRILTRLDAFLGRLAEATDPDDRVLVCSDHGMMAIDTIVQPNAALAARGWLTIGADGRIRPDQSVCFLHPAENGLLMINCEMMTAKNLSKESLFACLLSDLKAASGRSAEIFTWDGGGKRQGKWNVRHYLTPGPRCQAKANVNGPVARPSRKTGDHCVGRGSPQLDGTVIDVNGNLPRPDGPIETHDVAALLLRRPLKREAVRDVELAD
jgi:predicted AlkP superfamily phosphohydrolase/phosphomutase